MFYEKISYNKNGGKIMWLVFALTTFLCWGTADLFYKIGNETKGNYNPSLTVNKYKKV